MTNSPVNNISELSGGLLLPVGTTGQRPTVGPAYNGLIRYNSSLNVFEVVISGAYVTLQSANTSGLLVASNNLNDVSSESTSLTNLLPTQTGQSGKFLQTNGTNVSWVSASVDTGTVTSIGISGGTTGLTAAGSPFTSGSGALALSGTIILANGGTGETTWQTALTNLGYSANVPAPASATITLTNPMSPVQNIAFTTTGKNLVLPAMNAGTSIPIGWPIFVTNVGTNSFSVLANDGATNIAANLAANESVFIFLLTNATANGTFTAMPLLLSTNNLSELTNVSTARTNLGLGTAATGSASTFLQANNSLSEVTASTARTNLGLGSLALLSSVNNSNWSGTVLSVTNGGTGASTFTAHGILVGNATSAISAITVGVVGTVLLGQGVSANPSYSATPTLGINATTTGSLGLDNGNTGGAAVSIKNQSATTAYNFNLPATVGTSGQILTSAAGGSSAMTWTTLAASATTDTTNAANITTGTFALARFPTIAGSTVLGNTTSGTTTPSALTASQVLGMIGTTTGSLLYANASTWTTLTPGTSGQLLQTQGASANPIWASVTGQMNVQTFNSSGTWTKPASGTRTWIQIWGAGGGGGGGANQLSAGGGGGGGYNSVWVATSSLSSTVIVTIGAGGAGGGSGQPGAFGGDSIFGTLVAGYGGGPGFNDNAGAPGGGGGGLTSDGQSGTTGNASGGTPVGSNGNPNSSAGNPGLTGGGGSGLHSSFQVGDGLYGGGGGGGGGAGAGGNSLYGGGGGAHGSDGSVTGSGGASVYAGKGGDCVGGNGQPGVAPAGGGSGGNNGTTNGGFGAAGKCIVMTFP